MSNTTSPKVMLKLSGEVLAGEKGFGLNPEVLNSTALQLVNAQKDGARAAVVLGGGNIFRGLGDAAAKMDRVTADEMGMLATVINGLALKDAIISQGGRAALFTARPLGPVGKPYVRDDVQEKLDAGYIVILSGGTGNPFFSTDSGAALRAAELSCDLYLKGTKVDGVYDSDPAKNSAAKRYDKISYDDMIEQKLTVMDLTASTLLRENRVTALVYKMTEPDSIYNAALGKPYGTLIIP
ncbi:MAG: UMP kinase [Deltaproteobacteria bacterium]|nr:UMP kinase [Deltaproteobacteria bacterium]